MLETRSSANPSTFIVYSILQFRHQFRQMLLQNRQLHKLFFMHRAPLRL